MTEQPDLAQLTADGLLPIREVARLTGVNAVTLRAWERRYGLIVPARTAKGHRLYEAAHIQRIRDILIWLNRGVAVSQIKPLLEPPRRRNCRSRTSGPSGWMNCCRPSTASANAIWTMPSTAPWRCTRRARFASTCCSPCSRRSTSAGAGNTARLWSGCCSSRGYAASSPPGSISTTASRAAVLY